LENMKKYLMLAIIVGSVVAVKAQIIEPPVLETFKSDTSEVSDKSKLSGATPQTTPYVRPSLNQRAKRFANNAVGVGLIGVSISSIVSQARNEPPEWKKTSGGFARRFGSNLAENVIAETIAFGLEESLKLDSKYYKSTKRDFGSRFRNAILATFTARNPAGKRVFNPSRIVASYSSNVIAAEAWYPKRFSYKDGLREGTQNLAFSVGFNLIREFIFNRK
ncbi:MAG: hypothetical protein LH614_00495, partial [Pyrinomonadaceae bacterium]|nr:hypothetical protein [Pyrinomonadaceae bacterium]